MRLRTQSLLVILPLFLLIGAAGAGATWLLESRNWRLGAEEQARGMAAGLAEFLAGQHWITTGAGAESRLRLAETRLARWEIVRGIRIRNAKGQVIHQWSTEPIESNDRATKVDYWVPVAAANEENSYAVGKFVPGSEGNSVARGGAVVWNDSDGEIIGWVECELDASDWEETHASEIRDFMFMAGGIAILGILMALLFNQLVLGDIRKLIQSTREVGGGKYVKPAGLKVSEFQDLSEAFSVVDSLTHENRMKFRRSLIENEIFRTNTVLIDAFKESVLPNFDQVLKGRRVVSRLFDQANGVRWHGGGETSDRGWLWYGAVRGEEGIETAVRALAVSSELESLLLQDGIDPKEAVEELMPVYDIEHVAIVAWSSGDSAIEKWSVTSEEEGISLLTLREERFLSHDLDGDMATTIEVVWQGSRNKSVEHALGELEQFLGKTNAVISVIVPDYGKND